METRGRVFLDGQAGCRGPGGSDNTPKFSRSQGTRGVTLHTFSARLTALRLPAAGRGHSVKPPLQCQAPHGLGHFSLGSRCPGDCPTAVCAGVGGAGHTQQKDHSREGLPLCQLVTNSQWEQEWEDTASANKGATGGGGRRGPG